MIQLMVFRNSITELARLKAKLGYIKGLRTPYLEEFTPEGKLVGGYPEMIVNINDEYKTKGIYRISLELIR